MNLGQVFFILTKLGLILSRPLQIKVLRKTRLADSKIISCIRHNFAQSRVNALLHKFTEFLENSFFLPFFPEKLSGEEFFALFSIGTIFSFILKKISLKMIHFLRLSPNCSKKIILPTFREHIFHFSRKIAPEKLFCRNFCLFWLFSRF